MITPAALIAVIKLNLLRRPLMHAITAEEFLDVDRKKLNVMVENGELPWAFDIGQSPSRSELRILAVCVVERCSGPVEAIGATKNLGLPEVLSLILPQKREAVRGCELQRMFHTTPNAIHDMDAAGQILKVKEKLARSGPNGSPRFTVKSVADFLGERRVI